MNNQVTSTSRLCLLGLTLLLAVLLPGATIAAPASPGDGDADGIITGPRLVGGTVFRGCFASGPDASGAADPDWDKDVDTITGALKGTGSWQDANMTKLKNGKRADIEACVNAAKGAAEPGDEFIFYFSGHGGNHTFQDGVKDQHETTADPNDDPDDFDNHLLLGDTTAGTRSRMSDDELAKLLSGFKKSVTIVVILDSCNSHTFTDGSADLGSVTQKDPEGNDVPATTHLALIAASTVCNPTCSAGMTDRIADGLKSQGDHLKADKNKDGVVTAKEAADHARAYLPDLKPKCDEAEPFVCPMPEEPGATYRGPLPPDVDNCPTEYNSNQEDTDGDYYGDVCDDDDDDDGLTDLQETEEYGTNPLKADTEGDGMPDGYEVRFPCLEALVADGHVDSDLDGNPNLTEYGQGTDPCTYGSGDDYGDAPEGGPAYPALGVMGAFPTCKSVTAADWVQHGLGWARFVWSGAPQSAWDVEPDGNAGLCPNCFPSYDADECYRDGDAGLMFPQPYTIDNFMNVATCPNSLGTALGSACQMAAWGGNADIWIVNTMPVVGFVNVLMDWDQNGQWGGAAPCSGGLLSMEHVLVDWPVPLNYNGPLSGLGPPGFMIGPNAGHVWTRFSITEQQVGAGWPGEGAFEDGETEDYLLRVDAAPLDWGDAPDSTYPTLAASNGANHTIQAGFMLGNAIDAEADGQPDAAASGDDNDADGDDEDGVAFLAPIVPGRQACVVVTASGPGALDAWIDYDLSGAWEHPAEHLFGGASTTVSAGTNHVCFTVPATALPGSTFARFRLSSAGGLAPWGPAPDGEVEDYKITVDEPGDVKWVQPPDPNLSGHHTHDWWGNGTRFWLTGADDWLCQGGLITDVHWWGNYELDGSGVEKRGSGIDWFELQIYDADPTGLPQPGPAIWGAGVWFELVNETPVGIANPEGSQIYHYRFVLPQPVIQVPGRTYWFGVTAYSNDPTQPAIWRWQESSRSGPPWQGQYPAVYRTGPSPWTWSAVGSDMAFVITSKPADLGDAPDSPTAPGYPTLLANGGATHAQVSGGPFMGPSVDAEADGQPNATATGDDQNILYPGIPFPPGDENGVIFRSAIVPGRTATVDVDLRFSSKGCLLDAWLDFNRNASWADAGEQIFASVPLASGLVHTLAFNVPDVPPAQVGITSARFRCSMAGGLGPGGAAPDGEVEDYRVELLAPPKPPDVSISRLNVSTLQLSWPKVMFDIYGNARQADGYRIYWNGSPYWTPAPGSQWMSLWEPGLSDPVTQDAAHLGAPSVHHFYIVRAVYRDIDLNDIESADSNRTGEFEFSLVPGTP